MDGNGYPDPPGGEHRERSDRDRDRSDRRDRDRDRDRDRGDRDRRRGDDDRGHKSSRHRSRSRSRDRRRSRSRSRSRSPPRRQRRRPTQWDVLPEGGVVPSLAAVPPSQVPGVIPALASIPGMASVLPGLGAAGLGLPALGLGGMAGIGLPPTLDPINMAAAGMAALGGMGGMGGLSAVASSTHSQQATRHARRVYVGGLPPTDEQSVSTFFSHALAAIGGNTAGPGQSVVNVYMNKDKNFAFIEFRTVEETSNAMALDGIMFEGVGVRIRRPNDYNAAAAALLGPANPSPSLNLAAIGLGGGGGGGAGAGAGGVGAGAGGVTSAGQDPDRVFVGGLPYYLNEEQCKELLGSFGGIKSFDLVKDRETGNSKGYGFVVYSDPGVVDIACAGLNGLKMGERTLTVRRAADGARGGAGGVPGLDSLPLPGVVLPGLMPGGLAMPAGLAGASRIVVLKNAVDVEELRSDTDYEEIVQDMQDECAKYGAVLKLTIPRPTAADPSPQGLGLIMIEYGDLGAAVKAKTAMHGRKFGGHTVEGTFLSETDYLTGNFHSTVA